MMNQSIIKKINSNLKLLTNDLKKDTKYFSYKLAVTRFLSNIFRLIRLNTLSNKFQEKKNSIVLSYLEEKYGHIFERNISCKEPEMIEKGNLPIWVCWLDGIDQAPVLVKRCIKSIFVHAGTHPVHLITYDNISEYVEIPSFIYNRVREGEMGLAHFSDVIRVFVLEKYGGLWLDATIFCAKDILEEYFEYDIFSCKSNRITPGCISNNRWTTFCLGGQKGEELFVKLKEFFVEYWSDEKYAIDYLFFDDAIERIQKHSKEISKKLRAIPNNNENRDELIKYFADSWEGSQQEIERLLQTNTVLYKLGYRESYFLNEKDKDGNATVYSAFIRELF